MTLQRCSNCTKQYDDGEYISCPYCRKTRVVFHKPATPRESASPLPSKVMETNDNNKSADSGIVYPLNDVDIDILEPDPVPAEFYQSSQASTHKTNSHEVINTSPGHQPNPSQGGHNIHQEKTAINPDHIRAATTDTVHRSPSSTKTFSPAETAPVHKPTRVIFEAKDKIQDSFEQNIEPAVGWLIVINGPGKGHDLKVLTGMNHIGREVGEIQLNFGDPSISRERHAMLAYDFDEKCFLLAHQEGRNLTKINGKTLMGTHELQPYDRIRMGKTEMLFIPLCGEQFAWESETGGE